MNIIISDFPPVSTFELCDPSGAKEEDFTDVALQVLQRLRPDCTLFPFHPKVFHDDAVWTPDLAVVDKEFSYWFVVEVETATHHLEKHVIPQVTAFCEGRYDSSAAYMLAESLRVGVQQAETLLATIPRDVVVVSNKRDEQWNRKLAALGVQHLVIETYRNKTTAQALYRIDGDLLPVHRSLGFGRVRLRDGVVVTQATDHWTEGRVTIHGPDGAAIWICSIVDGRAWLMKEQGLIEFQNEAIIQFLRRHDGTLIVRLPYLK